MTVLLPEQANALAELQATCDALEVDVVVIGAIAYRAWMHNEQRTTEDVDAVVALDLSELPRLTDRLTAWGWRQDQRHEHRWYSSGRARFDLLPVGERTRREKQIAWPRAEITMSLVGYDHVFAGAIARELAPGLRVKIVPPVVLALLKIVAYLDDPYRRQKDLGDLAGLMHAYEEDGERRFSDEVLDAGVDYTEAGAYLLGRDLAGLCSAEDEREAIDRFLQRFADPDDSIHAAATWLAEQEEDNRARQFSREIAALRRGFREIVEDPRAT